MSDLISRQAAIDAIEEYADRLQMVNWKENPNVPYKVHSLNWCINTIRDLPSAQPEIVHCEECVYRRSCMLQHFVESNAVDGKPIDWSEWYCADGVWDISKSDERQEKK